MMRKFGWMGLVLLIVAAALAWRSAHGQWETPPARDTVVGFDVMAQDHGDVFFSVLVQDATGRLRVDVYSGEGVKTGHIPLISVRPGASSVQPMP